MLFQSWMLSLNKSWHHRDVTCENGLIFEGTSSIRTWKNATPSFEGSKCLMFTNTSNSKSSLFCLDLMSCPCSFLYVNTNSTEVYFGLGFFEGVLMLFFLPLSERTCGQLWGLGEERACLLLYSQTVAYTDSPHAWKNSSVNTKGISSQKHWLDKAIPF